MHLLNTPTFGPKHYICIALHCSLYVVAIPKEKEYRAL